MDIKIASNTGGLDLAGRARLERLARSILKPCASRTSQAIVRLEPLGTSTSQHPRWECRIYARLLPSGVKAVAGDGEDAEAALRRTAELLAWSLQAADARCLVGSQSA